MIQIEVYDDIMKRIVTYSFKSSSIENEEQAVEALNDKDNMCDIVINSENKINEYYKTLPCELVFHYMENAHDEHEVVKNILTEREFKYYIMWIRDSKFFSMMFNETGFNLYGDRNNINIKYIKDN